MALDRLPKRLLMFFVLRIIGAYHKILVDEYIGVVDVVVLELFDVDLLGSS